MSYHDTVEWMFRQLPMYQQIGDKAYKKDLGNILKLSEHISNPHKNFKSIHVAGTNGKGSTSHMLSSILQESGYKVGLYTSPHLKDFRERIKINGTLITKKYVVEFIDNNKSFLNENSLSFFEMTVGMAFSYFSEEKVDIAVVEVGLGGRLDSTNIISPEVSVITNIGLDHTAMLGNTLEEISLEKAGIIKRNIPVIIGETQHETEAIFRKIASEQKCDIYFADQLIETNSKSDLIGNYQAKNIKTVIQTIEVLKSKGCVISGNSLKSGLLNVVKNTGLLGRWQILNTKPTIICDTAHNKEGLKYVMQQLLEEPKNNLHIVFGVVADKDLNSILPLLPLDATYYFCAAKIVRSLDVEKLKSMFKDFGINGMSYNSVQQAIEAAKKSAAPDDVIFVGGSTFVVAEVV